MHKLANARFRARPDRARPSCRRRFFVVLRHDTSYSLSIFSSSALLPIVAPRASRSWEGFEVSKVERERERGGGGREDEKIEK